MPLPTGNVGNIRHKLPTDRHALIIALYFQSYSFPIQVIYEKLVWISTSLFYFISWTIQELLIKFKAVLSLAEKTKASMTFSYECNTKLQ